MGLENEPTDLHVDVRISGENRDEYDLLAAFFASFYARDDSDDEIDVGEITGWIAWSATDDDVADAADSLSADAAYIGHVAQQIISELREDDPFLEDVLLLDRIWIDPRFRGKKLLGPMIDRLIGMLRLEINGCVIVAEPEPQKEGGGPYPDGPLRDRAMGGLVRSLQTAGLKHWKEERAMWKLVVRD